MFRLIGRYKLLAILALADDDSIWVGQTHFFHKKGEEKQDKEVVPNGIRSVVASTSGCLASSSSSSSSFVACLSSPTFLVLYCVSGISVVVKF